MDSEEQKPEHYIVTREGGVWSLHCRAAREGDVITKGEAGWPAARIGWFLREGWIAPYDGPPPAKTATPTVTTSKKVKSAGRKKVK